MYTLAMASISIRDLDDAVLDRIKARAKTNHRSLAAELRAIISAAAKGQDNASAQEPLCIHVVQVDVDHSYGRDVIYDDR